MHTTVSKGFILVFQHGSGKCIVIATTSNRLETIIIQKGLYCQPTNGKSRKHQISTSVLNRKY